MGSDGEPWPTAPGGSVLASDAFCWARALHTPAGGGLRRPGEALCFGSPPGTGLCALGKLEGRVENVLVRLLCPCSQPSIALLLTGWVSAAWASSGDLLVGNAGSQPPPQTYWCRSIMRASPQALRTRQAPTSTGAF